MTPHQALTSGSERELLEHIFDGLLILDGDGHCVDANAQLCEMLGLERDALLALSYGDLLLPEELARRPLRFTELAAARRLVTERRFRRSDGAVLDVEVGTTLLDDGRILTAIRDITERRAAEAARRQSDALLQHAFQFAGIGMALVALDGRCRTVNPALCALLGYTEQELLDRNIQAVTHPEDLAADLSELVRLMAGVMPSYRLDKRYLHRDGHSIWAQLNVSLVRDEAGLPQHFVAQVVDLTALKAAEEQLRALAVQDELTGLLNRRGFRQHAERELELARRAGLPMLLMYLDLDRFKELNDAAGHAAGDAALAEVARLVRSSVRDADLVGRVGGDEFVILAMDRTGETLDAVSGRILTRMREAGARGAWPVPLDITIGVTRFDPAAPLSLDELLHRADAELYEIKRGRQRRPRVA